LLVLANLLLLPEKANLLRLHQPRLLERWLCLYTL